MQSAQGQHYLPFHLHVYLFATHYCIVKLLVSNYFKYPNFRMFTDGTFQAFYLLPKSRLVPVASDDNLALLLLFRETITIKQRSEKTVLCHCCNIFFVRFASGMA